jgi:flagellar protein FlaG
MDMGSIPQSSLGAGSAGSAAPTAQPVTLESAEQRRRLIQAVKAINASELLGQQNELTFAVDRATHRTIVRVVNKDTREVVMQIPPESVLRMAADLKI